MIFARLRDWIFMRGPAVPDVQQEHREASEAHAAAAERMMEATERSIETTRKIRNDVMAAYDERTLREIDRILRNKVP